MTRLRLWHMLKQTSPEDGSGCALRELRKGPLCCKLFLPLLWFICFSPWPSFGEYMIIIYEHCLCWSWNNRRYGLSRGDNQNHLFLLITIVENWICHTNCLNHRPSVVVFLPRNIVWPTPSGAKLLFLFLFLHILRAFCFQRVMEGPETRFIYFVNYSSPLYCLLFYLFKNISPWPSFDE